MFLEDLKLIPLQNHVQVESLHSLIKNESLRIMKPSEVKQYLFNVKFNPLDKEKKPISVGKLDITWRNSFGELGHLQTHPLSQTVCV